jgi:hypothetical protein
MRIMLAGYTDSSGTARYNMGLAERRDRAVQSYLTGHGIGGGVISTHAFGEANQRVATADGVRELQNRRVESPMVRGPATDRWRQGAKARLPAAPFPFRHARSIMSDTTTTPPPARRQTALSRWDGEGGAEAVPPVAMPMQGPLATPQQAPAFTDIGPRPGVFDIERATLDNHAYRAVVWSGRHLQVTLMSIPWVAISGWRCTPTPTSSCGWRRAVACCTWGRSRSD